MQRLHRTRFALIAGLIAMAMVAVRPLPASGMGLGPRGGFSFKPDQVVLGAQADFGPLMPYFGFVPSLEFGFGNDLTVTAINADLIWDLPSLPSTNANIFLLGGPTVAFYSFDAGSSSTEIGLSLGGGLRIPLKSHASYYGEIRFGLGDIPDLKAMAGIMFTL